MIAGLQVDHRFFILLLALLPALLLSPGCSRLQWSSFDNIEVAEQFERSDQKTAPLIDSVNNHKTRLGRFSGGAKVLVSGPEQSDRVSIEFSSSSDSTFIKVKGSLGVEAAHFWMAGDSLFLHDRLEEEKYRYGINDYTLPFPFIYLRYLRLSDLLSPKLNVQSESRIWESPELFLLTNADGQKSYIGKEDYTIRKQFFPELKSWPSLTVEYAGYSTMNGHLIPRKIQLTNKEEKFRLFLLIQELEPDSVSYSLTPFRKGS